VGWWRMRDVETGQIDFAHRGPAGGPLANVVPGVDDGSVHGEGGSCALYGGDGPADAMDKTLRWIDGLYRAAWGRPVQADELRGMFNFCLNGFQKQQKGAGG